MLKHLEARLGTMLGRNRKLGMVWGMVTLEKPRGGGLMKQGQTCRASKASFRCWTYPEDGGAPRT